MQRIFLKKIHTYCHVFLAAIFIATLVPFHAFHKHTEDIHHVAMASNDQEHHHCKLDANFCKDFSSNLCEHKQHIGESAEKCFASQYHFIKHITLVQANFLFTQVFTPSYFEQKIENIQNQIVIILNNKGPPRVFN